MTLICFASQKGSPGTTATALAVAAALPVAAGRRKLLLEADSGGGTLAIRYRLPVEPGLLTLAAAVRSGIDVDGLWRHAQELPGGLPVVVCPDGPDQVHAAMAASGARLGRFLSGLPDVDVICDIGRLTPDSPSLAFVVEAGALLMVARPTVEQLQPAARRMSVLKSRVANLGWVLIGEKPYGPAEVEATYGFPVVGLIADDARSVASLENGGMSKRLRRHPFVRSSVTLAKTLADWSAPGTTAPQHPVPEDCARSGDGSVEPSDVDHRWLGGPDSWRPSAVPGRSRNGSVPVAAPGPDRSVRPPPDFRPRADPRADPQPPSAPSTQSTQSTQSTPSTPSTQNNPSRPIAPAAPVPPDASPPPDSWDSPRPSPTPGAPASSQVPAEPGCASPNPPDQPRSPFPHEETGTDRVAR